MTTYQVFYYPPDSQRSNRVTNITRLQYTKILGGVGRGSFVIPYSSADANCVPRPDWRIEIRRIAEYSGGRSSRADAVLIANNFRLDIDTNGKKSWIVSGIDANGAFLARRILAYRGGTSQTSKTGAADDLMKALVRENLTSGSTTDYDGVAITSRDFSDYINVQGDATSGVTAQIESEWDNLLEVLLDIQSQTIALGNEVIFYFDSASSSKWTFKTAINFIRDRTTNSRPQIFSPLRRNLIRPQVEYNYESVNTVYVGDGETGNDRTIREVPNASDQNRSVFGRSETFVSARNLPTGSNITLADYLDATGRVKLQVSKPRLSFNGVIKPRDTTPYGVPEGWDLGDKVQVAVERLIFTPIVRAIGVTVDENGQEDIAARVEALEEL